MYLQCCTVSTNNILSNYLFVLSLVGTPAGRCMWRGKLVRRVGRGTWSRASSAAAAATSPSAAALTTPSITSGDYLHKNVYNSLIIFLQAKYCDYFVLTGSSILTHGFQILLGGTIFVLIQVFKIKWKRQEQALKTEEALATGSLLAALALALAMAWGENAIFPTIEDMLWTRLNARTNTTKNWWKQPEVKYLEFSYVV